MPKFICEKCGTVINYMKNDPVPKCKCNVPFFRMKDAEIHLSSLQTGNKLSKK